MSNRFWQTVKVNIGSITDQTLKDMLDEIAKIDAGLARRLANLDWKALTMALLKDALKAAAAKVGGQYLTSGKDRSGDKFLAGIQAGSGYGQLTYALFQAPDGSLKAECYQYDHVGRGSREEITRIFEGEYKKGVVKAVMRLMNSQGQVQTVKEEGDQVVFVADLEVN